MIASPETYAELTQRYEQLRAAVLAGDGQGQRFGLGVLACRGMAAWMHAWQQLPSPKVAAPARRGVTLAGGAGEMVLASMALAHV